MMMIFPRKSGQLVKIEKPDFQIQKGSSNPDDLSKKISNLGRDLDLIKEMGRNARREYEEKYTPEKNYKMLMEIYNKTIEAYKIKAGHR